VLILRSRVVRRIREDLLVVPHQRGADLTRLVLAWGGLRGRPRASCGSAACGLRERCTASDRGTRKRGGVAAKARHAERLVGFL